MVWNCEVKGEDLCAVDGESSGGEGNGGVEKRGKGRQLDGSCIQHMLNEFVLEISPTDLSTSFPDVDEESGLIYNAPFGESDTKSLSDRLATFCVFVSVC